VSPVSPGPLRVLIVCTANICRSPMGASALAAACARAAVPVEVASAGFLFDGRPASDHTRDVMRARGHDLAAHRSRVVDAAVLDGIDLVLTMERRHARDLVLEHEPAAPVHTFKGFAALASAFVLGPPEPVATLQGDLRAFVRAVDATRGPAALVGDGQSDEVDDPHGRSARVHRKTADELTAAADAIAAAFAAVRAAS
jgi:protein-tyrosine phosphatase